jgi:hypothetical protein
MTNPKYHWLAATRAIPTIAAFIRSEINPGVNLTALKSNAKKLSVVSTNLRLCYCLTRFTNEVQLASVSVGRKVHQLYPTETTVTSFLIDDT